MDARGRFSPAKGLCATIAAAAVALACAPAALAAASETDCNGSAATNAAAPDSFNGFWMRHGPGWTGGDQAISLPLGDGRSLWLYADTILGTVGADDTRPPNQPIVHNTIAVQDGACLTTYHGGSTAHPDSLVSPADASSWYWPGAATIDGGSLKVVLNEFSGTDTGLTGWTHTGDFVAVISLADFSVQSVQPINSPASITWGSALLDDGGYTYVYGTDGTATKNVHVARVPAGQLDQPAQWQHYNGLTWTSDPATSTSVASGVSSLFSVIKTGVGYTIVSQDGFFSRDLSEYQGATPAGPFPTKWKIGTLPDPGANRTAYNAVLHPEFDSAGRMLLGYSINADDLVYTQGSSYRPCFVSVPAPVWGTPPTGSIDGNCAPPARPPAPPPPPPPAPTPPPAPARPGVIRIHAGKLHVGRDGKVRLGASCVGGTAPCRGAVVVEAAVAAGSKRKARVGLTRVASAPVKLASGRSRTLTLRLSSAARAQLHRGLRLQAQARMITARTPAARFVLVGKR